jgi:hypothetical protein
VAAFVGVAGDDDPSGLAMRVAHGGDETIEIAFIRRGVDAGRISDLEGERANAKPRARSTASTTAAGSATSARFGNTCTGGACSRQWSSGRAAFLAAPSAETADGCGNFLERVEGFLIDGISGGEAQRVYTGTADQIRTLFTGEAARCERGSHSDEGYAAFFRVEIRGIASEREIFAGACVREACGIKCAKSAEHPAFAEIERVIIGD